MPMHSRPYRRSLRRDALAAGIAFLTAAGALFGETGTPLTLEDCLMLAVKQSEQLRIQAGRQNEAQERLNQARGALLPTITFNYSQAYRDSRDTTRTVTGGTGSNSRIFVAQPLFEGFRGARAVDQSESDLQAAQHQQKNFGRALTVTTARAFYTLVQIETDKKNVDDDYKLLQDRVRELNERIRLGKSRESEVLMVESQMAALKAESERLGGARVAAVENLAYLTGVAPDRLEVIDDTPPATQAGPLEKSVEAARSRSDVLTARKAAESASYRVAIAKGARLPALNASGSWYPSRSGYLSGGAWDALLSLDLPLFEGGILRSRIIEENARLKEAEENVSLATRQAVTEIRALHAALVSSIAQAAALEDAYVKANKSYGMQLKDYRFGLVNNLDVLQSMAAMLDAKRNFDRAQIQTKLNKAVLDIAAERMVHRR